jgi:hypothetical protein
MIHFPYDDGASLDTPEAVHDPAVCDIELRDRVLGPAMLLEDVHLIDGHGAVSTAHTEADRRFLEEACRRIAGRVNRYLQM